MKSFCQFLTERCQQANSLLCVGLDPRNPSIAEARAECLRIIEATHPVTAAYKPKQITDDPLIVQSGSCIPPKDSVLAFHSPYKRQFTQFAVE